MTNPMQRQGIPTPALMLGLAGLLPFAISAMLALNPPTAALLLPAPVLAVIEHPDHFGIRALGAYGAVILSFLGGVRWGRLIAGESQLDQWMPLTLSVVPSLIAWPALLLADVAMLIMLIAGFVFQYVLDVRAVKSGHLPFWFGKLRLLLTSVAVCCLALGFLSVVL